MVSRPRLEKKRRWKDDGTVVKEREREKAGGKYSLAVVSVCKCVEQMVRAAERVKEPGKKKKHGEQVMVQEWIQRDKQVQSMRLSTTSRCGCHLTGWCMVPGSSHRKFHSSAALLICPPDLMS